MFALSSKLNVKLPRTEGEKTMENTALDNDPSVPFSSFCSLIIWYRDL